MVVLVIQEEFEVIIVAKNKLTKAIDIHPIAREFLLGWYKIVSESKFFTEQDLKSTFSDIRCDNDQFDFSIPGTRLQICTSINFDTQVTYIEMIRPGR